MFCPGLGPTPLTPVTDDALPGPPPLATMVTDVHAPPRHHPHPTGGVTAPGPDHQLITGTTTTTLLGRDQRRGAAMNGTVENGDAITGRMWKQKRRCRLATHTLRAGIKPARPCRKAININIGKESTESGTRNMWAATQPMSSVSLLSSPLLLPLLTGLLTETEGPPTPATTAIPDEPPITALPHPLRTGTGQRRISRSVLRSTAITPSRRSEPVRSHHYREVVKITSSQSPQETL